MCQVARSLSRVQQHGEETPKTDLRLPAPAGGACILSTQDIYGNRKDSQLLNPIVYPLT